MSIIKYIFLILFIGCGMANATTYYVRTDGSTATNCTGTTDAAYPGSGTGQACAFNHPNWALELQGQPAGALAGGDTLVIKSGTYTIGCLGSVGSCRDATYNISVSANCDAAFPGDCYPNPVPDGTSGAHTKIIGCSTSGCGCTANANGITSCTTTRPILTGQGRINKGIINLENSDYVDVTDLDITDGDDCGFNNSTLACGSADADEKTAKYGITRTGSTFITLTGLRIHGLYVYGLYGGGGSDLTVTNSEISYNSFGGWDADSCSSDGTCGVSGTITFSGGSINYNGCVEDDPGYGTIVSGGCYSQTQGGYGDGIGTHNTGGNWVFTNNFNANWNVADGVDLLYHNRGAYSGGTIVFRRSRAEGNAGNSIKVSNAVTVEDSFLIGNCGYHNGQSFTQSSPTFDYCRSNTGNPIAIEFKSGDNSTPKISSSTILSNADVGIVTSGTCTTGIDVLVSNNLLIGGRQYNDDSGIVGGGGNDSSSIYYDSGTDGNGANCDTDFVETYNLCYAWKEGTSACDGTGSTDATSIPGTLFTGTIKQGPQSSPGYYATADYVDQLYLGASSAALNYSDETFSGADSVDFNNYDRGASWDNGAFEYGTTTGGAPAGSGVTKISGLFKFSGKYNIK